MAHIRQSKPDSGLEFQVEVLQTFQIPPLRSEAGNNEEEETKRKKASTVTNLWTLNPEH